MAFWMKPSVRFLIIFGFASVGCMPHVEAFHSSKGCFQGPLSACGNQKSEVPVLKYFQDQFFTSNNFPLALISDWLYSCANHLWSIYQLHDQTVHTKIPPFQTKDHLMYKKNLFSTSLCKERPRARQWNNT